MVKTLKVVQFCIASAICVTVIIIILLSAFKLKLQVVDLGYDYQFYKQNSKENILQERKAWNEYYNSVETMLDSIDVNEINPILESNVGQKYLDSKAIIDSCYYKH